MNRLCIQFELDVEKLVVIEAELRNLLIARAYANHERFRSTKLYKFSFVAMRLFACIALALCVWLVAQAGFSILTIFIMLISLLLIFLPRKQAESFFAPVNRRLASWGSRIIVRIMLRKAKEAVPYTAEYEFRNDLVTYHRLKSDKAEYGWSLRLIGSQVKGDSFSLFFRNHKTLDASVLLLHESHAVLDEYLAQLDHSVPMTSSA